ncbi:unnamed protein product [Mesocestoides corti]|uniref:Transposase n=1 Tax=Mesocestoides corti TaxID=53468 RepID=A0A0R3UKL7_MESCO|nr:unnamed protein product [Mesocestoides corti]
MVPNVHRDKSAEVIKLKTVKYVILGLTTDEVRRYGYLIYRPLARVEEILYQDPNLNRNSPIPAYERLSRTQTPSTLIKAAEQFRCVSPKSNKLGGTGWLLTRTPYEELRGKLLELFSNNTNTYLDRLRDRSYRPGENALDYVASLFSQAQTRPAPRWRHRRRNTFKEPQIGQPGGSAMAESVD